MRAPDLSSNRLNARLAKFDACDPELVEETKIARVWKVTRADGTLAALKLYHGRSMRSEARGLHWLIANRDKGAVDVLNYCEDALLMEWLDGPNLGDLSREGQDAEANVQLAATAARLHAGPPNQSANLIPLEHSFRDLFKVTYGPGCPPDMRKDTDRAKRIVRRLLDTARDKRPLHGDLHHDNVIVTDARTKIIDPKGLFGDLGFELANAFRNPVGADSSVNDPDRARSLALLCETHLGIAPARQLAWAAAKCALSIAWRAGPRLNDTDRDADLLSVLLSLAAETCDDRRGKLRDHGQCCLTGSSDQ